MMRNLIDIVEGKVLLEEEKKLVLEKLPYAKDGLEPVMSEETINYHYGKLAKGYVDRFNKGEGDPNFNEAGAFLHNIFFPQFREAKSGNKPNGKIAEFINKHFGAFKDFQKEISDVAMKIQGSGWVYLAKDGKIKTITNHAIKNDIVLLIDWWEHAWALDYLADKAKYLDNIWKIINWDVVSNKL